MSSDGGSTWTALGSGARTTGGWARTGLSLPSSGTIRAQGRATAGQYNGSSSLIEQVANYGPPAIVTQPTNQTILAGQDATFSVGATGTEPLSYQWRFNGTNLSGASSASCTIINAQLAHGGLYDVVVTNSAGSVTSVVATLTVVLPPPDIGVLVGGTNLVDGVSTVSFGTNQIGQTGPTLTFTVTNTGPGHLTLEAVTLSGSAAADYVLDTSGLAATVAPGGRTSFTVAFRPTGDDLRSATLQIASNDPDESPFDITLSGTGTRMDNGFNPNANNFVYGVAVQADGKILLGGSFTTVGGTGRNRIARLNADGTLDPGFNPNADDSVYSVAMQADGKILLGGYFNTVGGTARNRIARVNANGTLDSGFNPNVNNFVYSVAVQTNGQILLGGNFISVGGVTRYNIARVNANGTLDPGFNPNANGNVWSVAVQADGKILLGGSFTNVGGAMRSRIARVNADGTLDLGFNPNANNVVNSVALQADGKILLGGNFSTVGGIQHNCIARLNADGTPDSGFTPNASNSVSSVAVQADGKILLGGSFTNVCGTARSRIARLNADGTLDPDFNPPNPNSTVYSVALQADGKILLGGGFTTVGATTRNRIARLLNDPATQTLTVPDATQVQWLRGGTTPEVEQVAFELSTDAGSTWTALGSSARISGGWARTGLGLPLSGMIRAQGRATAGQYNGSSSLIEQVASYALPPMGFANTGGDLLLTNGTFQMRLENVPPAGTLVIEASTNLADWWPLFTNTTPTNLVFFTDPDATNYAPALLPGGLDAMKQPGCVLPPGRIAIRASVWWSEGSRSWWRPRKLGP